MNYRKITKLTAWLLGILVFFQVLSPVTNGFLVAIVIGLGYLGLTLTALASLVIALIVVWKHIKTKKWKVLYPFAFLAAFFLLLFYNPISDPVSNVFFKWTYGKRMEAVEMYQHHKLKKTDYNDEMFVLPYGYKFLSDSGEISKAGDKLLFFDTRGILDNFSGYVYSKDGSEPTKADVISDIVFMKKINKHWYYISCT